MWQDVPVSKVVNTGAQPSEVTTFSPSLSRYIDNMIYCKISMPCSEPAFRFLVERWHPVSSSILHATVKPIGGLIFERPE